MARKNPLADKTGDQSDDREIPETPARSTRSTRDAYPIYTATPARMTRAAAKKASDALPAPPAVKKTAIPAGISIEQLPSPTRLPLRTSSRRGRKNADVDALLNKIGSLELGETTTEQNARSARTRSTTAKLTIFDESSSGDAKDLQLEPVVLQALRQSKATDNSGKLSTQAAKIIWPDSLYDHNEDTFPETTSLVAAKVRELVMGFQHKAGWSRPMRLWEVESSDIEELEAAIKKLEEEGGSEHCGVFRSMHTVMETFQGFRAAFDEYLEAVDKCGLEMDWTGEREM